MGRPPKTVGKPEPELPPKGPKDMATMTKYFIFSRRSWRLDPEADIRFDKIRKLKTGLPLGTGQEVGYLHYELTKVPPNLVCIEAAAEIVIELLAEFAVQYFPAHVPEPIFRDLTNLFCARYKEIRDKWLEFKDVELSFYLYAALTRRQFIAKKRSIEMTGKPVKRKKYLSNRPPGRPKGTPQRKRNDAIGEEDDGIQYDDDDETGMESEWNPQDVLGAL